MAQKFFVYMMANHTRMLYIGMTNDLLRRTLEHRAAELPGYTQRYHLNQLVYFEEFDRPQDAIEREKELKGWRREKKITLIERENPGWADLAVDW